MQSDVTLLFVDKRLLLVSNHEYVIGGYNVFTIVTAAHPSHIVFEDV